jgi:diguanylate cyclase (GGDEF)-like protein
MFPVTREVRQPGRHINDILKAVAETGEQKGIPAGLEEQWIEEVAATLDSTGEQEIQLCNERWLHVRTRPTADGASLVVVSDVTTPKKTESALRKTTEQLRLLATTDGLTGLTNRRAFDQALENEVARAQRSGLPLSVLMIDVDRFKAYNDLYGHPAGDEVLRRVGLCLRGAIKRPGDLAARYGGEEFVAILPNTDEDATLFIANAVRDGLRLLEIPHGGSEMGIVTASIGVASLLSGTELDAAGLMARADEALYMAKSGGRDRITGWRPGTAAQHTG